MGGEGLHREQREVRGRCLRASTTRKTAGFRTPPDPDVTGAEDQGATGGANVGRAVTAETM